MKKIFILLLYTLISISIFSQYNTSGTLFWYSYLENSPASPQYAISTVLYVSSESDNSVIVSIPGSGWIDQFDIPGKSTVEIIIPSSEGANISQSNMVLNKGIKVESLHPVSLYASSQKQGSVDATHILPVGSLGDNYIICTYSPFSSYSSEFIVVGIEDGTLIEITPRSNIIDGVPANVPFLISLDQGQVYLVKSMGDLTGSTVRSLDYGNCNNFAVFAGNQCANIPVNITFCDHLYEQMPPLKSWGKEYITTPLTGRRGGDIFRILSSADNTLVSINGSQSISLNSGEFYELRLSIASHITGNNPISVVQYSRGGNTDGTNSDPFMIVLSPVEQSTGHIHFHSFLTNTITSSYANITSPSSHTGEVLLDGQTLSGWFPVSSNPAYSYISVSLNRGSHTISSPVGIQCIAYGFGSFESYGYIAGSNMNPLNISFDIVLDSLAISYKDFDRLIECSRDSVVFRTNSSGISDIRWDFGDGSALKSGSCVSHSFPSYGSFSVSMSFLREGSCIRESISTEIRIDDVLDGIVEFHDSIVCNGHAYFLDAGSGLSGCTYQWHDGTTNPVYNITENGNYSVSVTNSLGCTASSRCKVSFIDLNISVDASGINCHSDSNGSLKAIANGSSDSFDYLWDNGHTTDSIFNLSEGIYSITVSDSFGCSVSGTYNLMSPSLLNAVHDVHNINCSIGQSGNAVIRVDGGTPPYEIIWTGSTHSGFEISDLEAGEYHYSVIDSNGCSTDGFFSILAEGELRIENPLMDSVVCNGEAYIHDFNDGRQFTYLWHDGSNTSFYNITDSGEYSVTISDSYGCYGVSQCSVDFRSLTVEAIIEDLLCHSEPNGTISLIPEGSSGLFEYLWNTVPVQTAQTVTNLDAGEYTVTVSDSRACSVFQSYTVGSPPAIEISHRLQNIDCFKTMPGSVLISVEGGMAPYQISWEQPLISGFYPDRLTEGHYIYTITDDNGCSETGSFNIAIEGELRIENPLRDSVVCNGEAYVHSFNTPGELSYIWQDGNTGSEYIFTGSGNYSVSITGDYGCSASFRSRVDFIDLEASFSWEEIPCNQTSGGVITVIPDGTSSNFEYLWNTVPPLESPRISNLEEGTYSVTVTDSYGCFIEKSHSLELRQFDLITASQNVKCNGDSNGSAIIRTSGGIAPFSIIWSEPRITGFSPEGLAAGNYFFTVLDSHDCSETGYIIIEDVEEIVYSTVNTEPNCYDSRLSSTVLASGGTAPLNILWHDGHDSFTHNDIPANVDFGFRISDANNCTINAMVNIQTPPEIEINPIIGGIKCYGNSDASIQVEVSGGIQPYRLNWNNGSGEYFLDRLHAGEYKLTVTDSNECIQTKTIVITAPSEKVTMDISIRDAACYNQKSAAIHVKASGGTAPYTYLVLNIDDMSEYEYSRVENLYAGNYIVKTSDANGCEVDSIIEVFQASRIKADFRVAHPTCTGNSNGFIELKVEGGTEPYVYKTGNISYDMPFIMHLEAGVYDIEIWDANNCMLVIRDITLLESYDECIKIPDAFTPNGDGINDTWLIDGMEIFPDAEIKVFNKWGQYVFDSKIQNDLEWNGKFNDRLVPAGTYMYVIDLNRRGNRNERYSGTVTVIY